MDEKQVLKYMSTIPNILEYLQSKADEQLNDGMEATLAGQTIKSIKCASLAEHFLGQKSSVQEIINDAKSDQ